MTVRTRASASINDLVKRDRIDIAGEGKARDAVARADEVERTAAEESRRRVLFIEGRSRLWARRLTGGVQWVVGVVVVSGAAALIIGHPFHRGWVGITIGIGVVVFVTLELLGILGHVSEWRALTEARLTTHFRQWLSGDTL